VVNPLRIAASPLSTVWQFGEPLSHLRHSPELLVPLRRRGGTTLERPRVALPPGHVADVPGAGELFYRDTGPVRGRGPNRGTLLLLHGWMVPSDAHWMRTFGALHARGWRVIAMDARGHGRGLRTSERFRIADCAEDAIALIKHLDPGPVTVVGYSMGGLIAQLIAYRAEPGLVAGAALCATGCEFRSSLAMRAVWSGMSVLQVGWQLAPQPVWGTLTKLMLRTNFDTADWMVGELARGAAWDIAEAGREIGRFDSRPWLEDIDVPVVVLVTLADLLVPPSRQRDLAERLGAPMVEINADHLAPATTPRRFHDGLVEALGLLARGSLAAVG